ncbi:MAG: electron transport complex subunit RsxE [Candidatus Lernaella stagnicola]|nr:electron transport complex subunit RsxE [Candidatus Lernaella stagnicola]
MALVGKKTRKIFWTGFWEDNPVFRQILGICSTLAVTNLIVNTAIMNIGLVFVTVMSSATVSLLRNVTPRRIRMMVQVLIIAAYVIAFDLVLKAYLPDISKALGAYVGLIITNCIIMGRAEAFAGSNKVWPSIVDGFASGLGYAAIMFAIAFPREILGFGTLFYGTPLQLTLFGDGFTKWIIMVMAPGAFFTLAIVIWIIRGWTGRTGENEK